MKKANRFISFALALILSFGFVFVGPTLVSAAGSSPENIAVTESGNPIDKVLISQEQMKAYRFIDRKLRQSGMIGFEGDYAADDNGMVSVIVEFVQQPALVQKAEAEVNRISSFSMSEAKASALDAHDTFRAELDALINEKNTSNGIPAVSAPTQAYEVTSEYYDAINGVAITLPANIVEELSKLDSVWAVYPNNIVKSSPLVEANAANDPETRGMLESREFMGIEALHEAGITGEGVVIGVLDSGIDYNHPSFEGAFSTTLPKEGSGLQKVGEYYYGRNFVVKDPLQPIFSFIRPQGEFDPMETTYEEYATTGASSLVLDGAPIMWQQYVTAHGTHVAGTIAGRGGDDNSSNVLGIAPGATLLSYRVLGPFGAGYDSWILGGLDKVAEDGCDVVNMSLGASTNDPAYVTSLAVNNLIVQHDITFALAAGNDGPAVSSMGSPGTSPLAITVANGVLPITNHDLIVNAAPMFANPIPLTMRQLTSDGVSEVVVEDGGWTKIIDIIGGILQRDENYGQYGMFPLVSQESQSTTQDGTYTLLGELDWEGGVEYAIVLGKGTEADFAAMDPDHIKNSIVLVGRGLPFVEVAARAKRYGAGMVIVLDYPEGGGQPQAMFEVSSDYVPLFLLRDHWNGTTHTNQNCYGWIQSVMFRDDYFGDWQNPESVVWAPFDFYDYIEVPSPLSLSIDSSIGPVAGTMDIKPDITAPGTNIASSVPYYMLNETNKLNPNAPGAYDGAIGYMSGTSMASPHIAGVAALMVQYSREEAAEQWSSSEIKARMMNTAIPLEGKYSVYEKGAGFIDVNAAIGAEAYITVDYNDVYLPTSGGGLSSERGSGKVSSLNFRSLMVDTGEAQSVELGATITNTGSSKTFNVSHEINLDGFVLANSSDLIASEDKWTESGVTITHPETITVGNNSDVGFTVNANVPAHVGNTHTGIYEGYLVLTNQLSPEEVYKLPFSLYLRPESSVGTVFLNHPAITTNGVYYSDGWAEYGQYAPGIFTRDDAINYVHSYESMFSHLYLEIGEPASYVAFFVAPGDITDIYDQSQYLGETGTMIELTGLPTGALVCWPYTIGPAYYEYEDDGYGGITVDPMVMKVFDEGHYKIIAMVVSPFGPSLAATDLYVDNTRPVLSSDNLSGNTYIYDGGSRSEVTITGNIYDDGLAYLQENGIDYQIYEPTDPHGPEADQGLNAIFARVKDAPADKYGNIVYSKAIIQANGDFELTVKGLNVSGNTQIDIYLLDHYALADYSNVVGAQLDYEFNPDYSSMVKEFEFPFAFNGVNKEHKVITVQHEGPAVVLNAQSAVRHIGGSIGLVPTLNPEAIIAGYGETFTWQSSDERVVEVDEDGIVTAINWGTAVITYATQNAAGEELYATCTVYVPGNHDGLVIDPFSNIFVGQYEYAEYPYELVDGEVKVEKSPEPYKQLIYGEDNWEIRDDMWIITPTYIGYHTLMPMMWDNKGEETHNGLGDRMLTLSSTYALTDMKYNENGEWSSYGESDLNAYLNGEFITDSFSDAEQNAIPNYTVVSGIYDQNGNRTGEEVLEDQRAYVPWGIPVSSGGNYSNYVFWSSEDDLNFDHSYKGASNWRNRRRSKNVGEVQWASYYLRSKSPESNEVLYAKGYESEVRSTSDWDYYGNQITWFSNSFGTFAETEIGYSVSPIIKLDMNSILGTYSILSTESTARGVNENLLYIKIQETESFKLALLGGNNGADVGTLAGIDVTPRSISTGSSLSFSVTPSEYGSNRVYDELQYMPEYDKSYSYYDEYNYVIAYKVVGGSAENRTVVKSGEISATNGNAHTLNLGSFSTAGDYTVYVWLMNKCDRKSYEVGTVYSFPLNVSGGSSAAMPVIDRQPQDTRIKLNDSGSINVIANTAGTFGDLTYQWYRCDESGANPVLIEGATDRVYEFPSDTAGVYYYYVRITNTIQGKNASNIVSNIATVTVADNYTVTFMDDTELVTTVTVAEGEAVGENWPADLSKSNYQFIGWATETGEFFTSETVINANVTLYAQWESDPRLIGFEGVNGSSTMIFDKMTEDMTADFIQAETLVEYSVNDGERAELTVRNFSVDAESNSASFEFDAFERDLYADKTITVYATYKGEEMSYSFVLDKWPEITGIAVSANALNTIKVKSVLNVTYTTIPAGAEESIVSAEWTSSNVAIAKVEDGVVTGLKAGMVTITLKVTTIHGTVISKTFAVKVV